MYCHFRNWNCCCCSLPFALCNMPARISPPTSPSLLACCPFLIQLPFLNHQLVILSCFGFVMKLIPNPALGFCRLTVWENAMLELVLISLLVNSLLWNYHFSVIVVEFLKIKWGFRWRQKQGKGSTLASTVCKVGSWRSFCILSKVWYAV